VEVAGSESGQVIGHSGEFASFIAVGKELGIVLRVTEAQAKLCVVVRDELFGVIVRVRGGGVGRLGRILSLPGGGRACCGPGLRSGGGRLREGRSRGCHMM